MITNNTIALLVIVVLAVYGHACSSTGNDEQKTDGDTITDGDDTDGDEVGDESADGDGIGDGDEDEPILDGLPNALPFSFQRTDEGEPQSAEDLADFSERMALFFHENHFFDWVLRMSHGVDVSTGLRDFRLWWSETHAVKENGHVSIIHNELAEHGGHNMMIPNAKLLASVASAYMITPNETVGALTEQYCKGVSSTMLGMVHDSEDPIRHLMARSVIMLNHTYQTHDGYEKNVDYSNWFFSYDRWNCSRFQYAENPYWGEVWVTNTRSKDDLGYLFDTAGILAYVAARGKAPEVRSACAETLDLLQAFSQDIVDNGYQIRTKDPDGVPYTPSNSTGPSEAKTEDLASFVFWDGIFPESECNHTQAAALMGYGDLRATNCSAFGGNPDYEVLAIRNNPPNGHLFRSFHIAAIRLALINGLNERARTSLEGLEQRFIRDVEMDLSRVATPPERWFRDIALSRLQAAAVGYPLTTEEILEIQSYFKVAVETYDAWALWNIWDASVPDGEYTWEPPSSREEANGQPTYWVSIQDMGLLFTYCASPFKNPAGAAPVDCSKLSF
jgi:hypothetical protein